MRRPRGSARARARAWASPLNEPVVGLPAARSLFPAYTHVPTLGNAGCIYLIVSFTANRNVLPVGYMYLLDPEGEAAWTGFGRWVQAKMPFINDAQGTTIGDGQKGMLAAMGASWHHRRYFRCAFHRVDNLVADKSISRPEMGAVVRGYHGCAMATTDKDFDRAWATIPLSGRTVIERITREQCFPLKHPNALHGRTTSQLAEAEARWLKSIGARAADPITALTLIVSNCTKRLQKQIAAAIRSAQVTDQPFPGVAPQHWKHMDSSAKLMRDQDLVSKTVPGPRAGTWKVPMTTNSARHHIVQLASYACCSTMRVTGYPCPHYMAAAEKAGARSGAGGLRAALRT